MLGMVKASSLREKEAGERGRKEREGARRQEKVVGGVGATSEPLSPLTA
jgi:hypothetical protein